MFSLSEITIKAALKASQADSLMAGFESKIAKKIFEKNSLLL